MAASLLFKSEIEALLSDSAKSSIKDASLELTIGDIFLPGATGDKLGSIAKPLKQVCLQQGQSAVIRTAESLALPKGVCAIGFPPSTNVSLPGLLTTNPGFVDPGFAGPLHLTVINMGKEAFPLRAGDRIMRVLLFRDVDIAGVGNASGKSPLNDELLSRLSADFLDVGDRARQAAKVEVKNAEIRLHRWQYIAPVLAATLGIIAALVTGYFSAQSDIQDLRGDLRRLEAETNPATGVLALRQLNERVQHLESRTKIAPAPQGKGPTP